MFLRTTCEDYESQISCRGWASPQPIIGYALPGTYYAFVDSLFAITTGSYKLDIATGAPYPGESCENAEALTLATTLSDSIATYGHDMGNKAVLTFDGQGPDRVWRFTETTTTTRTVTFSTPSFGWTGNVFVQEAPCLRQRFGFFSLSNKNDGKPVTGTFATTAGKTYYVVVEAQGSVGGSFTLRVE